MKVEGKKKKRVKCLYDSYKQQILERSTHFLSLPKETLKISWRKSIAICWIKASLSDYVSNIDIRQCILWRPCLTTFSAWRSLVFKNNFLGSGNLD